MENAREAEAGGGKEPAAQTLPKWLAVLSAILTIALSVVNGYWTHEINDFDQRLKAQQQNLDEAKERLQRYTFVEQLLHASLTAQDDERAINVNLIKLALTNDEAARLFAGLDTENGPGLSTSIRPAEEVGLKAVAQAGTRLVSKGLRIFVHLGKHDGSGTQELARVSEALAAAGFPLSGFDKDTDQYGPGVDYFFDTDRPYAEKVAATLNTALTLKSPEKVFVARYQAVGNKEGTLGIWF